MWMTLVGLLILIAAVVAGPIRAAAPSPHITPGSLAGAGVFTVILRGATDPASSPTVTPTTIIVPVPGTLNSRPSSLRYPHPLPMLSDVVVAQHDPATVWVVGHLTPGAHVPLDIVPGPDALTLTFGRSRGATTVPVFPSIPSTAHAAPTFSVRWTHVPVSDVIAQLAKLSTALISADPRVTGLVTLHVDNATLESVLGAVARQVHARVVHGPSTGYRLTP